MAVRRRSLRYMSYSSCWQLRHIVSPRVQAEQPNTFGWPLRAVFILAHNHPSGDPQPSTDDVALTARVKVAAEFMGIDLLDHVIIGHGQAYSFKQAGRLAG